MKTSPPRVGAPGRRLDAADRYITVTSEYNHGYLASLKNAMDYVFPEFNKKPMMFVSYVSPISPVREQLNNSV